MYINTVETCWTPNHSTSTITLYVIVLNDIKEINSIHVRLQKKKWVRLTGAWVIFIIILQNIFIFL